MSARRHRGRSGCALSPRGWAVIGLIVAAVAVLGLAGTYPVVGVVLLLLGGGLVALLVWRRRRLSGGVWTVMAVTLGLLLLGTMMGFTGAFHDDANSGQSPSNTAITDATPPATSTPTATPTPTRTPTPTTRPALVPRTPPPSTPAPAPAVPVDACHQGGVTYCALNPAVTPATIGSTICVSGWTATVRPPESYTEDLKRSQIRTEGLPGTLSD